MAKKIIATTNAPGAIGPYSQAVQIGNLVYTSGQLGMTTAAEMPATIEEQTKLSLENVKAILAEAGTDMSKVVKTLVFIKDMNDFGAMNGVYQQFFTENFPARSCVEVARLPKDALVEIEVIAEV
jgi:2-iminobutanoate/2-iminopropanoate deaminase